MKQLVMCGPRKSKVVDVPDLKVEPGTLLVKVKYTGALHVGLASMGGGFRRPYPGT